MEDAQELGSLLRDVVQLLGEVGHVFDGVQDRKEFQKHVEIVWGRVEKAFPA